MKIFWSWQSDNHQPSGRHFVRTALDAAAEQLATHPNLEDAERPTIDSDTSGVPGSPPIADTILRKIRECAVFVADVTPVGQTLGGKKLVNPNVMIELGYALAEVGPERIVLVMNQAEGGSLRTLPFDLRHWRGPITYSLSKSGADDLRETVLRSLTDDLVTRLGPSLEYASRSRTPASAAGGVQADEDDPAVWNGARPITTVRAEHLGDVQLPIPNGSKMFVRIIPAAPFQATRADMSTIRNNALPLYPLGDYQNVWKGTSRAGAVAWNASPESRELRSLTQWFQTTGEIWAIWPDAFVEWKGRLIFTDAYAARGLESFLTQHFATLERFSAALPWRVIVGVRGLHDTFLPASRYDLPALANEATYEELLSSPRPTAVREIASVFLRHVHDAYGAPNLDTSAYERLLQNPG